MTNTFFTSVILCWQRKWLRLYSCTRQWIADEDLLFYRLSTLAENRNPQLKYFVNKLRTERPAVYSTDFRAPAWDEYQQSEISSSKNKCHRHLKPLDVQKNGKYFWCRRWNADSRVCYCRILYIAEIPLFHYLWLLKTKYRKVLDFPLIVDDKNYYLKYMRNAQIIWKWTMNRNIDAIFVKLECTYYAWFACESDAKI